MIFNTANFRDPVALFLFFGVAAFGIAADLVTKYLAVAYLADGSIVRFLPGLLHFEYTVNYGAVFGIGQGKRPVFILVSILALGFLSYLFSTSAKQRSYQLILGMLLAGVLGNLYDRAVYGHVRDMLHALPGWYWPQSLAKAFPSIDLLQQPIFPYIFNLADVFLVCGVSFMLIHGIFFAPPAPNPSPSSKSRHPTSTPSQPPDQNSTNQP